MTSSTAQPRFGFELLCQAQRALQRLSHRAVERRQSEIARQVWAKRLTCLSPKQLERLLRCLDRVNANNVPGDVLELGVAAGGSVVVLASLRNAGGGRRKFQGYFAIDDRGPNAILSRCPEALGRG